MATYSCSHWWHAPIYLTLSIFLAAMAITSFHPPPPPSTTLQPLISTAAAATLRTNNFSILSTLLQFSPQLFPTTANSSTVFALHDTSTVFSDINASSSVVQLLLQFHVLPVKLTFQELVQKQSHSCLPTLIPSKNVSVTKSDVFGLDLSNLSNSTIVKINNITISHPNLFLDEFISIHGVLQPFTSLNDQDFLKNPNFCNYSSISSNSTSQARFNGDNQRILNWVRMIRALSSKGFISFAIGLNSVMNQVLIEYPDLDSVTVLAPLDFGFVGSSKWILDRVVRYHVIRQRYSYSEFIALPANSTATATVLLSTLLPGNVVEVSVNNANVSDGLAHLAVNGVEVVSPEIYSTRTFVVHGISRALDFLNHVDT